MPSPRLRQLQDESVTVANEIETLRAIQPADEAEAKGVEDRLAAAERRADEIAAEAAREKAIDARIEALRAVRTSDSDARKATREDDAEETRDRANYSVAMGNRGFSSKKAAASVGEYIRQVVSGECRAMGETSPTYDAKGVDFVMGELYGAVVNRLTYNSFALQLASVFSPSADRITVPKIGDATVSIVAEGTATTDQDLSTSGSEIRLYEHRLSIAISRSLLEDSPLDVAGVVAERIGLAFAKQIDALWLAGNAANPAITGLAAAVAGGNTITVGAAANTTMANLADVVGKVDEAIMNPAWVVSRAGWVDLMKLWAAQQTTTTVGGGRVVPTIMGVPVYLVKGLPATTLALYGDFKMASAVAVKANGLEIEVGRELLIRSRQVLYAACQRIGVNNHDAQYVGRLAKA